MNIKALKKSQVESQRLSLGELIPLDFPLVIYVEASSLCNLACTFCPHYIDPAGLHKQNMELDVFKKIIDEGVKNGLCAIKLQSRGEAMMHPKIFEYSKKFSAPIVYASSLLNYPINGFFIRSSKKEHGLQKQIEGNFKPNSDVIIIDDTVSTGGSLIESIKIVQQHNSKVKLVLSILDRKMGGSDKIKQLGYNFNSIFSITDKGEIE